ncbi:MAG: hypothetical protein O2782_01255 [bacterium]|nr:hypothetical protein [bacterium]
MLSGECIDCLASAFLAGFGRRTLLICSGLCALRFLRLAGAFFTTCLLAFGQGRTSLAPIVGTRLTLLGRFSLLFGTSFGPLFPGLAYLLLLLAVLGDRTGPLDLLSSSTDL